MTTAPLGVGSLDDQLTARLLHQRLHTGNGQGWPDRQCRVGEQVGLGVVEHPSPGGHAGRGGQPEEAQRRLGEDRDREGHRRLHDDQPGGISELFHRDHLPDYQARGISQELEEASGSQGSGAAESIF